MLDIANMLSSCGLKNTPHRHAIIQTIDKHGHIDIDTLYSNLSNKIKIPLGTLYRSIGELQDSGIVKSVVVSGLKPMFEIDKKEHSHFVCDCCGAVLDIDYKLEAQEVQSVIIEHRVSKAQVIIHGVCAKCNTAN